LHLLDLLLLSWHS